MVDLQTCTFTIPETNNADGSPVAFEHLVVDADSKKDPRDRCGIAMGLLRYDPDSLLAIMIRDYFDIEGQAEILLRRDEWCWVRAKGDALFDDRLPVLSVEAELAEARMLRQDLRRADAELCRVLKENEDLWKENERLKAMIRSLPTTPKTELQIRVALGHVPTREEIIASLETPADRCTTHVFGVLGERCPFCGDVIDGTSKEQRRSLREEIADHVLKDWRRP